MPKTTNRRLSIVDAARLLYRTNAPSDQQIGRIYERMKAGAIRVHDGRGAPHDWTTTEQALADYVAAEMMKRQNVGSSVEVGTQNRVAVGSKPAAPPTSQVHDARTLKGVYHSIWRDAFLAVLLRRRLAHRSARFHRGVLVCQIVILVSLVGIVLGVVRFTRGAVAPERIAVERWIDQDTDTHEVTRWHPSRPAADGHGVLVEVEYRYTKETRRPVSTQRTFRVSGEKVSEVSDG